MPANTVYCHVLGGNVTVTADINGVTTNVVCPEFNRLTFSCGIKGEGKGVLARTFARMADKTTGTRARFCEFVTPGESPFEQFFE